MAVIRPLRPLRSGTDIKPEKAAQPVVETRLRDLVVITDSRALASRRR